MTIPGLLSLALFAAALAWLARLQRSGAKLSTTTLYAMLLGVAFGGLLQAWLGTQPEVLARVLEWVALIGGGYVRLLQLIVMPLVLVSILAAVVRLEDARALGRIGFGVIALLLLTTGVAALIGVAVTHLFGLSAEGLAQGARELERGAAMETRSAELAGLSLPQLLLSLIPTNIFSDLTGARPTSIVGVVLFGSLLGVAALALKRDDPGLGRRVEDGIDAVQQLVMRVVRMVIRLTPFGVLALMARVVATSSPADVASLIGFVAASYVGLAAILVAHALILVASGLDPVAHFRRVLPVLAFAFSSRSSAATIPLNVEAQVNRLGISPAIANFSASFGATMGQNGCAGLYPAMLAVMIAPVAGIDPLSADFILSVVLISIIGSVGIAGVGGGATFAAIVVLSALDLPIALAGLLISIEPLIDMGRTAVNVSGAMTAGAVTNRVLTGPPLTHPAPARIIDAFEPAVVDAGQTR